jgi:hypothetical protein
VARRSDAFVLRVPQPFGERATIDQLLLEVQPSHSASLGVTRVANASISRLRGRLGALAAALFVLAVLAVLAAVLAGR